MTSKIKRIHIQNFKPFEDYIVQFNSQNLIVFDGPNGFGKTSFYDAIELLFTGSLRRYADLVDKVIDKRHASIGSPLLNDRADSDLVIKAEVDINGKIVFLARVGDRDELLLSDRVDKPSLQLFVLDSFESNEFKIVNNETDFLDDLLGKNYISNFEHLNYIEQEENIYLLKSKDKDRKEAIAHLFNTSEFDERIRKLADASKILGNNCGSEVKTSLQKQKSKLEEYRRTFTGELTLMPYERLVPWKWLAWDKEKLDFTGEQYVSWLGNDGELKQLEVFINNVDEFKKDRKNKSLDELLSNMDLLNQLLQHWVFVEKVDHFNNKLRLKNTIDDFLEGYSKGVLTLINANKFKLDADILEIIGPEIDVVEYSQYITDILELNNKETKLSKLLVSVKESRQIFISKFLSYQAETELDSSCPLCGYTWQDAAQLKSGFDEQATQIEQLLKSSDNELNVKLNGFEKDFVSPIKAILKKYQLKHPVDSLFVRNLKEVSNNRIELETLNKKFSALDIDISQFLNQKPVLNEELDIEGLSLLVKSKKAGVNQESLRHYYGAIFLQIFDESYDLVTNFDLTAFASKRKYIEWQYSLYQSAFLLELEGKYEYRLDQFNNYQLLKKKVDSLKRIYQASLTSHQKTIIESIEILFHIYSGRIAQEGKGGLGLFINSDKNGIRFLENHSKQHDAIFSMSSGQLATLVIAFTLALNKRYSQNKLLFIDDPVQTLDELNIAGLVELLRNEFKDRQIFISTHEDTMSTYMRYKFEKYNLGAQRISFKESQLSFN